MFWSLHKLRGGRRDVLHGTGVAWPWSLATEVWKNLDIDINQASEIEVQSTDDTAHFVRWIDLLMDGHSVLILNVL